jgi:hypothetical protein
MASRQECEKIELILGTNNFEQPAEASGAKAWANLITTILFMVPGTMPSDPEMGCDIGQYEFSFIDDVKDAVQQKIMEQVTTYFPDIPLNSVDIYSRETARREVILIIQLSFTQSDGQDIAVVAAEKTDSIINFEVAV